MLKKIAFVLCPTALLAAGLAQFAVAGDSASPAQFAVVGESAGLAQFAVASDSGLAQPAGASASCWTPHCVCMDNCDAQFLQCANACNSNGGGHACMVACTQEIRDCQFACSPLC